MFDLIQMCIYVDIYIYIHTHVYQMHIYVYTYTHIYVHRHMHHILESNQASSLIYQLTGDQG